MNVKKNMQNQIETYNVETNEDDMWESIDPKLFNGFETERLITAVMTIAGIILMFIGLVVLFFL